MSLSNKAVTAKRETKSVEFKDRFNPSSEGEWCELLKDFAAIANSGGGIVVIGARNNGTPSGLDVQRVLDLDGAVIADKLFRYTALHHAGFEIHEAEREGHTLAVVVIEAATAPVVFSKSGGYRDPASGKQKTAFHQGTVYFRHGAKSEPASADDLRRFIDRRLDEDRARWLTQVQRIVQAPADTEVAVFRRTGTDTEGAPLRLQLTTDPSAPIYGQLHPDVTHPYRQKELVATLKERLPSHSAVNSYDFQCLRKARSLNEQTRPDFCYSPKFGSMQYSDALVEWIIEEYGRDSRLFENARKWVAQVNS